MPGPPFFLTFGEARAGPQAAPLNAIRAFEAAGRHVGFTRAAAELHVTHGAVSCQVAQFEAGLGTALFLRKPSQLSLTEAGRGYLAEAVAALDHAIPLTETTGSGHGPGRRPGTGSALWALSNREKGFQGGGHGGANR